MIWTGYGEREEGVSLILGRTIMLRMREGRPALGRERDARRERDASLYKDERVDMAAHVQTRR